MNKLFLIGLCITSQLFMACTKKANHPTLLLNHKEQSLQDIANQIASMSVDLNEESFIEEESQREMGPVSRASLIYKSIQKRLDSSLFRTNEAIIKANGSHSRIYPFTGKYKVMVIPVQFSDFKFEDPRFFQASADGKSEAQEYIFGENENSMTSYYKHASMGNLDLQGEVTSIVTVKGKLADYGEAIAGRSDKNAPGLVVEALKSLMKTKTNDDWWFSFDNWDLSDYDQDKNFHEPDGFIDAVVLVYAGKSQASCQSSFDRNGTRPSSSDIPAGPRQQASLECFNRIWPHRWSVNLSKTSPDFTTVGPIVEGKQRGAMNGLKINDHLFATDYNMQSEFSDRSTFIHEFGHSLSLPDVYSGGKGNSSGSWEVMSQNASLQAQEMSSYSKISLGWLAPKIIKQGETTSAYLGSYNFVSEKQRENLVLYDGPNLNDNEESILSFVPDSGESVYRSIMVITDPTKEGRAVVESPSEMGKVSAYSSRFNNGSKSLKFTFDVPEEGEAKLSFDTIYHIETQTNFGSKEETIKVITDFDIGRVTVNDKVIDTLRLISGDDNNDTLAEKNKDCKAKEVLELRKKVNLGQASDEEKEFFSREIKVCQSPVWVKKSYDLSDYRGVEVTLQISYVTDPGHTELGIVVDNIRLPGQSKVIDFENEEDLSDFVALNEGVETITYNQYYLLEYRAPGESYQGLSYNMDNNISTGEQSMFMPNGQTLIDRFRMVTFDYQPGVLAWYFNSKYDRGPSGNDPAKNGGKGYLLVINPKVRELTIPGVFSDPKFKDENGHYHKVSLNDGGPDSELESLVREQRNLFVCFSHTEYDTYISGKRPDCSIEDEFLNAMKTLELNGDKLIYRRERINELLPTARYKTKSVGRPFRSFTAMRTGLSTFRPKGSESFSPFKVFKSVQGEMVLDQEMTKKSEKVDAVSVFQDSENNLSEHGPFHGDTAIVEKKGFRFEVTSPSRQILGRYNDSSYAGDNDHRQRRPRAKVYFDWD